SSPGSPPCPLRCPRRPCGKRRADGTIPVYIGPFSSRRRLLRRGETGREGAVALETDQARLRIAATGDVHCRDSNREAVVGAFAALGDDVDLVLIAGDLTSHGTLAEAEILCEAAAAIEAPVYAVLGNHDWHNDEAE